MTSEEAIKKHLSELPSSMSKGQQALEALSLYRSARLPVPDTVLRVIDDCYRHFTEGKPTVYRPDIEKLIPSPMTLGSAFGVPDIRGGPTIALKRKRLALLQPKLVRLFTGQGTKRLIRSRVVKKNGGFFDAAAACNNQLTVSEIEDWVSKNLARSRKNNSVIR